MGVARPRAIATPLLESSYTPAALMPNWFYLFVSFAYELGLALWIGGIVVLGALVAPRLFSILERPQAGEIFGGVLRRFARLRLTAILLVIAAAAVQYLVWETRATLVWIVLRWLLILGLTAIVSYEIAVLEPAMANARASFGTGGTEESRAREDFQRLHRRSETLMKISFVAALGALFLT